MKIINESELVNEIKKAVDYSVGDIIEIVTPQFEREKDKPKPLSAPITFESWCNLSSLPEKDLDLLGLRKWGRKEDNDGNELMDTPMLWLFPGEWFNLIPDGLLVTDIFFNTYAFLRDEADNDIRFGMLAYGILEISN